AAARRVITLSRPSQSHEAIGCGREGVIDGRTVRVGSHQMVCGSHTAEDWALRALIRAAWRSALSVFVAVEGQLIGVILLADELRRETPRAVQCLRTAGGSRIVMVAGER